MDRVSQSKEMYFSTVSLELDSGGFVPVRLPSAVRAEFESVLESASAGCGPQHGRNSTIFVTRGRPFFLRVKTEFVLCERVYGACRGKVKFSRSQLVMCSLTLYMDTNGNQWLKRFTCQIINCLVQYIQPHPLNGH